MGTKADIINIFNFTQIPFAKAQTTEGLIGYWNFNEGAGTTTADVSGNGHTGTLNGPTWTTGQVGNALSFDGSNDFVSMGTTLDISALPFTVSAWISPSSFNDYGTILGKRTSYSGSGMRFNLDLEAGTGRVLLQSASSWLIFSYAPQLNQWTHLTVVADTSSTKLYVNGSLQQTLGSFILGTGASSQVRIGSVPDGPDPFAGKIDELRIYNRGLTTSEITEIYNDTGTPPAPTPPAISSFTASPSSISQGNSSVLSWSTSGDPQPTLSIDNGVGTVSGTSTTVFPSTTTIYTLTATNSQGSVTAQATVTVTIPDATPPAVSLTAPASGATVSGDINVSASASDNVGVVGVQFKLDGANLGTEDTVSPYSISWNTTTATNASHSLTAVARDAAGNSTNSAIITVTVDNALPPPASNAISFPSNADQPTADYVAIEFDRPDLNGLPIWGPSNTGVTVIREVNVRQQTPEPVNNSYYYAQFWYTNANRIFDAFHYWGFHPYPQGGSPGTNPNSYWEVAGMGAGLDHVETLAGTPNVPEFDRWYTQGMVVTKSGTSEHGVFYIDLPSISNTDIIDVNQSWSGYGETPETPSLIVIGDSPWYSAYSHERFSGILGRIKIFAGALS
ncbi:MAG: Ig-like domain-containing protein, partial [Nitrospira sp.]|nr:Ig-like domain-containing protein [Nitrospira sp.]